MRAQGCLGWGAEECPGEGSGCWGEGLRCVQVRAQGCLGWGAEVCPGKGSGCLGAAQICVAPCTFPAPPWTPAGERCLLIEPSLKPGEQKSCYQPQPRRRLVSTGSYIPFPQLGLLGGGLRRQICSLEGRVWQGFCSLD